MEIWRTFSFVLVCIAYAAREIDSRNCKNIVWCSLSYRQSAANATQQYYDYAESKWELQQYFIPTEYYLRLSFEDAIKYSGKVNINGRIQSATSSLYVNLDRNYVKYNDMGVSLTCCSQSQPNDICILSIAAFNATDILEIKLNQSLQQGDECVIKFSQFNSSARQDTPDKKAVGLRISYDKNASATTTYFRMHYAPTVFPCLDYPQFKVRVTFCIEYPSAYDIVSGEPISTSALKNSHRARTCFKATTAIPIYMFGFALMNNYKYVGDTGIHVGLFVPNHRRKEFSWLSTSDYEVNYYMEHTILEVMPPTLHYVVLSSGVTDIEINDRLVFLDANATTQTVRNVADKTLLHAAKIRLIIQNRFTATLWNEICLQESLTKYYEMLLLDKLPIFSKTKRNVRPDDVCTSFNESLATSSTSTAESVDECAKRVGAFFKGTADIFGEKVLSNFLNSISVNADGGVGLEAWERAYAKMMYPYGNYSGYLNWYFKITNPVTLHIRLADVGFIIDRDTALDYKRPQTIPLKVYYSSLKDPITVKFTEITRQYDTPDNISWALVDPDGLTCVTKVYDDWSYEAMLKPNADNQHGHLTLLRKQRLVNTFCDGLMSSRLEYDANGLSQQWKNVARYAYNLDAKCKCCLRPSGKRLKCTQMQLQLCDSLPFVKLL